MDLENPTAFNLYMNSKLQSEIVSSYCGLRNLRDEKFKDDYVITKDKKSYSNLWKALDDFKRYEKVLSLDKSEKV